VAARNPIERTHDIWTAFARDDEARLLIWLADEDALGLLDAFVARECDPDAATTPDLFVQLRSPFVGERHGLALIGELVTQYEELARAGLVGPLWRPPVVHAARDDVEALLRVLTSFRAHHVPASSRAKLAVWLDPDSVQARSAYVHWLERALLHSSNAIRLMIAAAPGAPECALARTHRLSRN
jgi:hypothetical protein